MGLTRGNTIYAPVEQHSSKSSEMDPSETSKPEAARLLSYTETPLTWSSTMTISDKQSNGGAKVVEAQKRNDKQIEPKINWKQIAGCLSANFVNLAGGTGMAYTSSLIPALQREDSDIKVTLTQCAWIASVMPLASPVGSMFAGLFMDRFGRLATLWITTIPFCLAWVMVALTPNYTVLLIARIIMGFLVGNGAAAGTVLITETALKKYRGPLACTGITFASLGVLLGYVIGAMVEWRTAAWICIAFPLLALCLLCLFTAESPLWLRSHGRTEAARRACTYYYGDPEYFVQASEPQAPPKTDENVEKEAPKSSPDSKAREPFYRQLWLLISRPTGYKPLIILDSIFLLQQLSGIYITLFYAVSFFQTAGSPMDPYIASILIGGMRFFACGMCVFLLRACSRRKLMIISSVGMAICMVASGYSTNLVIIENGGGDPSPLPSWFPVACVVMYIWAASIGLQSIPWTMTAEMFPMKIRSAAQAVNLAFGNIFMFLILQAYPMINDYLGGAVGVQYAFAAASLLSALVCWVFQPETHGKTLSEIEDYFVHNTIFLCRKKQ